MLLSRDEALNLIAPYSPQLASVHHEAYKRRDEWRSAGPDKWRALRAATRGMITTDLVVDGARVDEAETWDVIDQDSTSFVEIPEGERLAALLRFRTVEFEIDEYGERQPVIKTPLSAQARRWFGNEHITLPKLTLHADIARAHTNLLVGHASDRITGELHAVVVACYLGRRVHYWFPVDAHGFGSGDGGVTDMPRGDGPRSPRISPIRVRPKEEKKT